MKYESYQYVHLNIFSLSYAACQSPDFRNFSKYNSVNSLSYKHNRLTESPWTLNSPLYSLFFFSGEQSAKDDELSASGQIYVVIYTFRNTSHD